MTLIPCVNRPYVQPARGFTVVELLVVVSLLTLLIALLMPALGRARNEARIAVCASNLRQVGAAVTAYMTDNVMDEPWKFANGSGDHPHESGSNDAAGRPGTPARALTQWGDHLPDGRAFFCPTVPIDYATRYHPRPDHSGEPRYTFFHGTYSWVYQKIARNVAPDPAGNGILYENTSSRDVVYIDAGDSAWFSWGFPYSVVHYNALKVDSHVETVGRDELDYAYYLWGEDRRPYN